MSSPIDGEHRCRLEQALTNNGNPRKDSVVLAILVEKDGNLRVVYARIIRLLTKRFRSVYYQNWKVIQ